MTKVTIFSGFLGAGKTTLIKKMIAEAYAGEKIVLIENEFGEIGIDGSFLRDAGIRVNEMNSGCICCSLVGDFGKALLQVLSEYHPDRILIEPSGVGKLSDVIAAVHRVPSEELVLDAFTTVADATKCKLYLKNFGEFYANQIETASAIILSRTDKLSEEKLRESVALLRGLNAEAVIVTTPWTQLNGKQIAEAMQHSLTHELSALLAHAHGEECDDEDCPCHHHHDGDEHEHHHHEDDGHEHHHHEDDEHEHHHHEDDGHEHHHHEDDEHEHHHEHDEAHHHHHHGHVADEVFQSWGKETPKRFTQDGLRAVLSAFEGSDTYGFILRAKGVVQAQDGSWISFDYVPGEIDIRSGSAAVTGRLCVIGSSLNAQAITELFGV